MLTYKMITNQGNREINEDSVGHVEKDGNHCFVIADGLGGHGKGDEASSLVCRKITSDFLQYTSDLKYFIGQAIDAAQHKLLEVQKQKNAKFEMKTTIVVLVTTREAAYWGHSGDSRLYTFYKGKLKKRTLDHSVPQMLVLARSIKEKEIRYHPDRNKLLKVMGVEWDTPFYDLFGPYKLKERQAFLLCTDGFWELITEKSMETILKSSNQVEQWLENMTLEVEKNGSNIDMDNYSAIAIMI